MSIQDDYFDFQSEINDINLNKHINIIWENFCFYELIIYNYNKSISATKSSEEFFKNKTFDLDTSMKSYMYLLNYTPEKYINFINKIWAFIFENHKNLKD